MDIITIERQWPVNTMLKVDNLFGVAMTGEAGAHKFRISGIDGSSQVAITGTITAKLLNANDVTIPLSGSLSDGVAEVTLTDVCYNVPGRFILSIFTTNSGVTQCIYCGAGTIFRSSSSVVAYPTAALPDISELIEDLQDILDGWPADYSTLQSDVSDLKTAITDNELTNYVDGEWIQNRVMSSGGVLVEVESSTFCHSGFLNVGRDATVSIASGYKIFAWKSAYDELGHGADNATSAWTETSYSYTYSASKPYLMICVMKSNSGVITPTEAASAVKIYYTTETMFATKTDVSNLSASLYGKINFEIGAIVGGADVASNTYARTKCFWLNSGNVLSLRPSSATVVYTFYYYGTDQNYANSPYGDKTVSTSEQTQTISTSGYYRLRVRYSNDATVTDLTDFNVYVLTHEAVNEEFVTNVSNAVYKKLLPPAWSGKVDALQKQQGKTFAFAIQTDTHFATHTRTTSNNVTFTANDVDYITLLKNLTKYIGFDFVANLGDLIRGYEFDTYAEMQSDMAEAVHRYIDGVCCPVMISVGNHDDACMNTETGGSPSIDSVMKPAEQYAKIFMPTANTCFGNYKGNGKSLYYYVDFDDVRVINLNSRDLTYSAIGSSDVSVNHNAYSTAQITWLTNTALNTDKQVLVLTHVPLLDTLTTTPADNSDDVIDALKAFETGGGRVIGVMCGHTHTQNSKTENGILHVVFADGGDFAECVFVDTANHTVVTKMIGNSAGKSDRTFSY